MEIRDTFGTVIGNVTGAVSGAASCQRGLWLELKASDGTKPTLCLIQGDRETGVYIGFYRDATTATACDLAVSFDRQKGPILQVACGVEIKNVNLFDMIAKLGGG